MVPEWQEWQVVSSVVVSDYFDADLSSYPEEFKIEAVKRIAGRRY